mmetsp:Transcript_21804/g.49645  ORF Transcript_21804/g.49645 Transcript_21804/m.49645 type:complete len:600 (+) Transcript_21804:97-1896(+)
MPPKNKGKEKEPEKKEEPTAETVTAEDAPPAEVAAEGGATASAEEPPAPTGPTHELFVMKLFRIIKAHQSQHGLRHNDHLRYRQYCSRRLRRLRVTLKFKNGRGRYKQAQFPSDFADFRYIEYLLVNAERAWSYGVQIKADNAAQPSLNAAWRKHSISRFRKAAELAAQLESVCKAHADQRTQLEAEAYEAFMSGTHRLEKEEWSEALQKLQRCKRVCEHLSLASAQDEAVVFKTITQEDLAPAIRECRYALGMPFGEEGEEAAPAAAASQKDLSGWNFRGQALAAPGAKIKAKLVKSIQMVGSIKVEEETEDSALVIERYGGLASELQDVLKDIHSDMISAGADGEGGEWRMLEAFAREHSICMNAERNAVLLRNHLVRMDGIQEMTSDVARKAWRPDEGMRYCDLLKEDLTGLQELPMTGPEISETIAIYVTIILNCRCLFLASCYTAIGKLTEAAALLDMLHARVRILDMGDPLHEPIGRLHGLFEQIQKGAPHRVAQWRCRCLVRLCTDMQPDKENEAPTNSGGKAPVAGQFPAKLSANAPKPKLVDLAFQSLEAPDMDEPESKSTGEGAEKKGVVGRIAGGVGSRLGSLFGRKQ